MKHALILMLSLCFVLFACDKAAKEESIQGKTCQIASVKHEGSLDELFTYDDLGRITKIAQRDVGRSYFYQNNQIRITSTIAGEGEVIITLDANRAVSVADNGAQSSYTFKYNEDGYLIQSVKTWANLVSTTIYVWKDGNFVSFPVIKTLIS